MSEAEGGLDRKTELAQDRTVLANERTFAGWMRTGLASVGVGVGFSALFRQMEPDWVPRGIATIFLLVGAWIVLAAERRACAVISKMEPHYVEASKPRNLKLIAFATAAATLALIAAIWLVRLDG